MRIGIFAMITKKISLYWEVYLLPSLFLCLFISCPPSIGAAERSTLSINFQGSLIELKAENVTLENIFKAISERAGISYNLDESSVELYSGDFKVPIEECFRRLLKNRNYILIYKDKGAGQIVLSEVLVLTSKTLNRMSRDSGPMEEPVKPYKAIQFNDDFKDEKKLLSQVLVTPVKGETENKGIKIVGVAKNSFFGSIGLEQGDRIDGVNAQPVQSGWDLIQLLKTALSNGVSPIIIERSKEDNRYSPIYINTLN